MSRRHPLILERMRNVDDEMLRSRDFRAGIAHELELHWWHQRAVHQAFGVASGLEVSDPQAGTLTVGPGVGYDASGRDLVLLDQATIDLPTSGPPVALVLRPRGGAPGATLAWRTPAQVDPCEAVALASFDPSAPDTIERLATSTRSVASPRIGTGETSRVATPWALWEPIGDGPSGIQVRVDTRAAGFTDLPRYFASLQWPQLGATPVEAAAYYALGLQYVEDEAVDAFSFRALVGLPKAGFGGIAAHAVGGDPLGFARSQQLYVCWMGVQCDAREAAIEELVVTVTGPGTVVSDVGGINVTGGGTGVVWLPRGTSVTLTAEPDVANFGFLSSWGGDCSGNQLTCTVSMTNRRSVLATFGSNAPQ